MRSRKFLAAHAPAIRARRLYKVAALAAVLAAFVVAIGVSGVLNAGAQSRPKSARLTPISTKQDTTAPAPPTSARITPVSVTQVNFEQLAARDLVAARSKTLKRSPTILRPAPPPMTVNDTPAGTATASPDAGTPAGPAAQNDTGGPDVASPSPSQTFLGQEDGPKIGTTTFTIPPDTNGAVGLDKVFTNTNQNYRVHDKATGAPLSTVNSDTFWTSTGGSGFFDPQIQFDPINQRWIVAIVSNAQTANSSIEVGVSDTPDPQGTYHLYRFIVGCAAGAAGCNAGGEWADFPMLGFNKNWVAVAVNMFTISTLTNVNFDTLVLDYPNLRTGPASPTATLFRGAGIGFCAHPVTTLDATQDTLFIPTHLSSGGATYKLNTITGTPAAPVYTVGATKTRPGGGWTQPGGDILPQTCVGTPGVTCPTTLRFMDVGDAQVRSNPVYRNGGIYYAQTVGIPAGGLTHTAAQWTIIDTAGNFVDGGRVEDPTATSANGGKWYAYPSLTVNKNGDILLGFSQFSSAQLASAGYTYRQASDTAGTMRDPVIYKAGEDYYAKTFSGTRNRWGDYSHTLIDPVNDRDVWTVQEYAQMRTVQDANTVSNNSRWGTFWAKIVTPAGPSDLKISEFRLRGAAGAFDEYIEIYNNNNTPLTVTTLDGSAGYAVAASDGIIRCTIPNGTTIPGRGHYLCVNSSTGGYSLSSYPAGNGTTATGDATFTTDIPDNSGIAIFNTATVANFSTTTRLDAVGFTSEPNALYREGAGIPAIDPTLNSNYAFYRDNCGKAGQIALAGKCPLNGFPIDTSNNAFDFIFVDTNGTLTSAGQRLGAPGPENLSSPIQRNSQFAVTNLDPAVGSASSPNRVRDFMPGDPQTSSFGTMTIRRTITNNTGTSVTRLRFRIVDITTFPAPGGIADLRARTSGVAPVVVSITGPNAACPANQCTVQQTTLEEPPAQPNGGAFNSTLSVGTTTLANSIPPGGSINVQFLLGIQATGNFRFFINVEALP